MIATNIEICETQHGIITKVSSVLNNIKQKCDEELTPQMLSERVNAATDIEYLSEEGEESVESMACYKLIGLGLYESDPSSAKQIYISLHRSRDGFNGFFVGSYNSLVRAIQRRFEGRSEILESFSSTISELYDMLMDKEYWKREDDKVTNLRQYLNATLARCQEMEEQQSVIVRNADNSRMAFNTRLLDKYGNFIYLAVKSDDTVNRYSEPEILISKSDFVRAGFYGPRPDIVSYFSDLQDVIFVGSLEEFDLEDTSKLDHVSEASRRQRLPEAYRSISTVDMSDCIKASVEAAMRQRQVDYSYFVPMYNISRKQINFLIPLKLQRQYSEQVEVALIIGKDYRSGFYTVNTMIDIELAYNNARTISSSVSSWLERAMVARRQSDSI